MIGKVVGNYKVVSQLGEGGMGVVYLAEHPVIGKKVALKVLHAEFAKDPEVVSRFFNEARAVNMIGHPGIVDVIDLGQCEDGAPYFTMEMLQGESLAERIRREGRLSIPVAVNIADQALDALAAAHGKGIIHRDIKPENVFLVQRGARLQVKILDFGIAKMKDAAGAMTKTQTGSLMGTPIYMSAEQCKGAGGVDHRTDIYSFAIVLYEMLVGRPPFIGETFTDLLKQHLLDAPVPLRQHRQDVPAELDAAIIHALEKEPARRFTTAGEFRDAVLLGAGDAAPTMPTIPTLPDPSRAATRAAMAGTATVAGVGAAPAPRMTAGGSTTLSHTAGESGLDDLDDDLASVRGGAGKKIAAAVGFLAVAGAAAFFVMQRMPAGNPSAASGAPPVSSPAPAPPVAPPAAAAPAPSVKPPEKALADRPAAKPTKDGAREAGTKPPTGEVVRVLIASDPAGARVMLGGKKLGETPYTLEIPKGEKRRIEIAKSGMKTEKRELLGDRDRTESVHLDERAAATASPTGRTDFDGDGALAPSWMK